MTFDRDQLLADLTSPDGEGFRSFIYDDATGAAVVPGYKMVGKATLAVGWCPQTNPCPIDLGQYILGYFTDIEVKTLNAAAPWVSDLSDARQRALYEMAYNLGVTGLLKFIAFMALMEQGQFDLAASDLAGTAWASQVGARAQRIITLIRNG